MDQLVSRQRRRSLTDKMVAALPKRTKRYTVADPDQRGLYVRVPPAGPNSFVAIARDPYGQQIWATLGSTDALRINNARAQARLAIQRIRDGMPAFEAPPIKPDSFRVIAEAWLKRHVIKNKLRTRAEIERCLTKYVFPEWENRELAGIRRRDIAALLDKIEDDHGARQADLVMGIIRSIANWHSARNDDFLSPFTGEFARAMQRVDKKKRTRSRVLSDTELRAVWKAADGEKYGALVRMLLLTGQRKGAVLGMRWTDVDDDGVWEIHTEEREKGNAGMIQLPRVAREILAELPRFASNPYVFVASRGSGPMDGSASRAKRAFDKRCGVTGWRLHDLRRCSRSLMSRCGVRPDIAEKTLGHVAGGVEAIYDRHEFFEEKSEALAKVAKLIEGIIDPPKGRNVVTMKRA